MKNNARTVALHALQQVEENEGYSNIVLDKALQKSELSTRDRSLTAALFYGVLEKRISLDWAISAFSGRKLQQIQPTALEILRMAVYQILYMQKIPDSAAVNEAVNLAKENHCAKAAGFINGVLRSLLRGKESLQLPNEQKDSLLYRSVFYNCPQELIKFWDESYGKNVTNELLNAFLQPAPVYVRVNTAKITGDELISRMRELSIDAQKIPYVENALVLQNAGSIASNPLYIEGFFHVQDLSSQFVCSLCSAKPNQTVLDVCSAPGGKSFTLAQYMQNKGKILSFDKYKGKVKLIDSGAKRLGLSVISAAVRDAEKSTENLPQADCVLCDAPCSGLGIIRRKPEIRYKSISSLDTLPDLQYRIITNSSVFVRPGGKLVYSTCTLNPKENGDVVSRFLAEHTDFEPVSIELPKGWKHGISEKVGTFTLFPQHTGTDGFFVALMRRKDI